jgi:Transposase DDE domain group 1
LGTVRVGNLELWPAVGHVVADGQRVWRTRAWASPPRGLHDSSVAVCVRKLRLGAPSGARWWGCVSDLQALRGQERLFGRVASETTAHRVLKSIDEQVLERVREARKAARARAWDAGGRPQTLTLDIDATIVTSHSEKEQAAGTYKHTFGFHPLLCYLDETGEALAGQLRAGNAGANTATDHFHVLCLALEQLPEADLQREILVRADIGGATHAFTHDCHARGRQGGRAHRAAGPLRLAGGHEADLPSRAAASRRAVSDLR